MGSVNPCGQQLSKATVGYWFINTQTVHCTQTVTTPGPFYSIVLLIVLKTEIEGNGREKTIVFTDNKDTYVGKRKLLQNIFYFCSEIKTRYLKDCMKLMSRERPEIKKKLLIIQDNQVQIRCESRAGELEPQVSYVLNTGLFCETI